MKKYSLLSFIAFITVSCFAQNNSRYTLFIQHNTAIQWAAESDKVINLSPKVAAFSLKKWYLDKIRKGTATAYKTEGNGLIPYQLFMPSLQLQDWLKGLTTEPAPYKNPREWVVLDKSKPANDYDRVKYRVGDKIFSADSCCGCDDADAFRSKQILHYKNGRFSIYNVFISPLCARQTATVPFEWYPLCNVAYNDKGERKFPGLSNDVVLLNTDQVEYEFSRENPSPFDSVLTVYRTDIGSLIYQDILKGNLKPVDIETGKPLSVKKFLTWRMPADTMAVIDENNEITGYKVVQQERSSADFSRLRIIQDLYFDFKNERLYSVVRSVILVLPVRFYDGSIRGYMPYCRLE